MISKYTILIREAHLDTFGHVNNATYMALYEEARWELITQNGYGLRTVQELKQGPVILDASIKFMRELKLREEITITTELVHYTGRIGQLKQQMIKTDGKVASESVFTLGLFDLDQRKLIDPTPLWKKAIGLET
jgi:YbgC/YbaW family acyl-CoA thioester hydrolase